MNLIFKMDGVICKHEDPMLMKHAQPLINVTEFMQWLTQQGHHITIWCERPNTLEMKMMTEDWLYVNQIPYDRLVFDRPKSPIFVDITPSEAQYYKHEAHNQIISDLFNEWKTVVKNTDVL